VLPVLVGLCTGCAAMRPHKGYTEGQSITVQGIVSDIAGKPVHDVQVVLEASRSGFSLYPFGSNKHDLVTGTATTDAQGNYGLQFPWNHHYDHFELVVAIGVATAHGDDRQELRRLDITRYVQQGTPVVVPVTLADTHFLDTLREFLGSLRTDEEQKAYHQAGKPDRVDRTTYPDHVDTAWWYFEQGKVYRFRDGHLQTIDSFAPVKPVG
jgi:hypothetical protein